MKYKTTKKFIFILSLIFCQIGFSASLNNAFNSGELSLLLRYRVDLDKKYLGVETMENFLVKPQGTIYLDAQIFHTERIVNIT
jgi:hypothetical protein